MLADRPGKYLYPSDPYVAAKVTLLHLSDCCDSSESLAALSILFWCFFCITKDGDMRDNGPISLSFDVFD